MVWTMVQCDRCFEPTIERREDYGGGLEDDPQPVTLYPTSHRLSPSIPAGLRREWDEAQTCFRGKAYTGCVVLVRRTLEGTCADQGVQAKNLAESLKRLELDDTLKEWADALRIVGNRGAHYTGELVGRQDAQDALAFAEALLDHIYVLRKRYEEFRRRLAN